MTTNSPSTSTFVLPEGRWQLLNPREAAELLAQDAGVRDAHEIWEGDLLRRAELEARILADQPADEIAAAMNESIEVIDRFEEFFFDVRCRSSQSGWIGAWVIGRDLPSDGTVTTVGRFWRRAGYQLGLIALGPLLSAVDRQELASIGLRAYLRPDVPLTAEYSQGQ